MKKIVPALFFLAVLVSGCGPGYDFSPYYGLQQNWQTSPGGYAHEVDGVMIYPRGEFPARPYTIVGSVGTDNEHNVAKAVKDKHADAALIFDDRTYRTGTVAVAGPGVVWGIPLTGSHVSAQLVKYR